VTANVASKKIITDFKPDIAVGTGGYVTAPVLRTAAKLGVKTVAHESNSLPGMATKLLARTADKVFVSSPDTLKYLPTAIITGNPLRSDFKAVESRAAASESLKLSGSMTILSFGGSLGANKITEAVIDLLKWEQDKDINHIHAYGGNGKSIFDGLLVKNGISPNPSRHLFAEYLHNMYTCMAAADLVICRAGSMSQTELKAFGRASVQIPWSGAAENHQYFNAKTMADAGAAIMIRDDEISAAKLIEVARRLYNDRLQIRLMEEKAREMSTPNAAGLIVSEMLDLLS
jgi:UDP-N-acetylglucosamine--N-acetylmuramyl-(pentapeptide) pyrophosphoryl-undecaprenol N-acetylglucosamine transferase